MVDLTEMGHRAREASRFLAQASTETKNAVLCAIAAALDSHADSILAANRTDLEEGRKAGELGGFEFHSVSPLVEAPGRRRRRRPQNA